MSMLSERSATSVIAAIQMLSKNDKAKNFRTARDLIEDAASRSAKIVFLPECFDFVAGSDEERLDLAETLDGPLLSQYINLARSLKVCLSLGGFHQRIPNSSKIRNSHIFINQVGRVTAVYDKLHLFDVNIDKSARVCESSFTEAGSCVVPPVDTVAGRVGLATCYDLRFPELSSALRQMDADILTFPSAFTKTTGKDHWEVLLRSRAIENQCYVVAAAQSGDHNRNRSSYGHTMIVDPWGEVLAKCHDEKSGIAFATVDLSKLHSIRSKMPIAAHRRRDIFPWVLGIGQFREIGSEDYMFAHHVIPAKTVFLRSQYSFGFVNCSPLVPGHVLVCPVRVISRMKDMQTHEVVDLYALIHKICQPLEVHFEATSLNIAMQDGSDSGQSVPHLHCHILPRRKGDFSKSNEVHEKLEQFHFEEHRKVRDELEMSEEATSLRKLFMTSHSIKTE